MHTPCIDHGRGGHTIERGYAQVSWRQEDGAPPGGGLAVPLHRLVYSRAYGVPISAMVGLVVMHLCDNRRCTSPLHLKLGLKGANNTDRANKDRSAKVVPSRHKLTREQALDIQQRYNPRRDPINGVTAIARDYKVDSNVIYSIVKGEHSCLLAQ